MTLAPIQGPLRPLQACPIPNPGNPEHRCVKPIPMGWGPEEGHGGGHVWMSPRQEEILDRGHFDARALLSGEPTKVHLSEECTSACASYRTVTGK
jgi:hypothetical protein